MGYSGFFLFFDDPMWVAVFEKYSVEVIHYLLGTGKSYSLTAQNMQDCLIFFMQPNYVHKTNKVMPPYVKLICYKEAPGILLPLFQFLMHDCKCQADQT